MKLMMTSKVGGEWKSYSTKEFVDAIDQTSRALLELSELNTEIKSLYFS
jgi:hypothetical protein